MQWVGHFVLNIINLTTLVDHSRSQMLGNWMESREKNFPGLPGMLLQRVYFILCCRKYCLKSKDYSSRLISPFPTIFSKGIYVCCKRILNFFFFTFVYSQSGFSQKGGHRDYLSRQSTRLQTSRSQV